MLVNDYLRFALKIFIYLGVLKRTPFDFQRLNNNPLPVDNREPEVRRIFRGTVNAMHSLLKSIFPALINIGKGLRIHVEKRKPAALNLDHDPVPLPKAVVHVGQDKAYPGDLSRLKRLGFFIAVPVFAPEDISANQHLVTTHLQFILIDSALIRRIREHVN